MSKKIFLCSLSIMLAGIFFVTNDAIIKILASQNIQFYHFIFYGTPAYLAIPIYLLITNKFKIKMYATNYYIPLIRSFLFAPMPLITFISLKNISLPEFTTLNMSSPIFACLFAIFILKEKINFYILLSISFGFIGVLLVVQPGFENFSYYFLLTLFGAFIITITTVITNKYHYVTSTTGYFVYGGMVIHILSLIIFIFDPILPNLKTFLLITIASIFINCAIFLVVYALRNAQKYYASIFCLVYLQIFWSALVGIIIFDDYLNNIAIIGAIFIVLSGISSIPGQFKQASKNQ